MNLSNFLKMTYENKFDWTLGENKSNSNPIKPNSQKAQMNVNLTLTKDYRKNDDFVVRKNKPNSNPISKQLVGAGPRWAESAKMAQIVANRGVITVQAERIKKPLKKPNLLKIKMLSRSHRPIPTTGTSFAHLEFVR